MNMRLTQKHLGYAEDERLLIVNADDFGMCHSFNLATQELLLQEAIASTTIMLPCPWVGEAATFAREHLELDVGIHLTFTSEWEFYRWGPVTRASTATSLLDAAGYFPATAVEFEQKATAEEVRAEIFRQIELGIAFGITPTHLDVHMGSLYGLATGRDFLDLVYEACVHYDLPVRMPRRIVELPYLPPDLLDQACERIRQADEYGIMLVDELIMPTFAYNGESYEQYREEVCTLLRGLRPGLYEFVLHPSVESEELTAIMPHGPKRVYDAALFRDPEILRLLEEERIQMISWKSLMQAQRRAHA